MWSHDGMLCTGEPYGNAVKMTFAKGAALDEEALKAPVLAAVALNTKSASRPRAGRVAPKGMQPAGQTRPGHALSLPSTASPTATRLSHPAYRRRVGSPPGVRDPRVDDRG